MEVALLQPIHFSWTIVQEGVGGSVLPESDVSLEELGQNQTAQTWRKRTTLPQFEKELKKNQY